MEQLCEVLQGQFVSVEENRKNSEKYPKILNEGKAGKVFGRRKLFWENGPTLLRGHLFLSETEVCGLMIDLTLLLLLFRKWRNFLVHCTRPLFETKVYGLPIDLLTYILY